MNKLNLANVTLCGIDTIDINRQLLAFEICMRYTEFKEMKLFTNCEESYTTDSGIQVIKIDTVNSLRDYNNFNLKHLNTYIDTDFVMIAEHDGFILNPEAWSDEFLDYDYIGAPWLVEDKLIVGNGGFSIRSKKLLELTQSDGHIQLGNKNDHKYAENEDWVICMILRDYIENKGIRFAPAELAKKFSIEENELVGRKWTDQFGFHGLKWTDISAWLEKHSEYKIENPAANT